MNRGSRYGRPVQPDDLDTLNTHLRALQSAALRWMETQSAGANPAGDQLCDSAVDMSDVLTELIQFSLAPSVHGLYVIQ